MKNVLLLIGAGQIGMAIARRMGYGMKIVIGDKRAENARAIAKTMCDAGFDAVPVAKNIGVDIENLYISQPDNGEQSYTVPVETDLSSRESIRQTIAAAE